MKFNVDSLKSILSSLVIGAALLFGTSGLAYAQDYHQRHEWRALRQHQRAERYYYGNSRALRDHQWQERQRLRYHQRAESRAYYYPYRYRYRY